MKDRDDLLEYHSTHQDDDEKYYRPFAVDIDDGWCYVQEVAGNLQEDYQRSKFKDDAQKRMIFNSMMWYVGAGDKEHDAFRAICTQKRPWMKNEQIWGDFDDLAEWSQAVNEVVKDGLRMS